MNPDEPSPAAFNLDELKLLPDWMKADAPAPPGVGHGNTEERFRDRGGAPSRGDDRRPERGGGRGPDRGPSGGGGGQRFERRPSSGGGDRDRDRRSGPPRRGGFDRDRDRDRGPRPPEPAPVFPARVRVEFVPDPRPLAGIAKEIRASHLAYPLFGLARMFLDRPERHRIRMSVEAPPRPPASGSEPASPAPDMAAGSNGPAAPTTLYQLGEDGPIATDRAALERIAFDLYRERFYVEQRVQKDPPKGNFTGVARERSTGTLLGPTNYHAYQANLRALYESRFSRRMSFENFRRDVDVVNDPALVERWKEETRTVTTYVVRDTLPPEPAPTTTETPPTAATVAAPGNPPVIEGEVPAPAAEVAPESTPLPVEKTAPAAADDAPAAESEASAAAPEEALAPADPVAPTTPPPTVLETLADARQHFREHYLEALVRARRSIEVPGPVGRQLPEASLTLALRLAHEQELKYPAGLVQPLRAGLQNNGLHIFKHRKRIVYVSAARPVPFRSGGEKGGAVSEQVSAILETVTAHPLINRKQLAERLLAKRFGSPAAHSLAPVTPAAPTGTPAPEATVPADATAAAAGTESTTTPHAAEESVAATPPVAPDPQQEALTKAKASLAADLRYLVQAGHIIEFHNGGFDLPLLPKPPEAPRQKTPPPPAAAATTAKQPQAPAATDDTKTEAVATPVPIAEREKAPDTTAAPPVAPPPENDDIFAPSAAPAATASEEELAPPAALAHTGDPRPEEAVAASEPFDGPESLPPPPAGVVEEKIAAPSPDPTLPTSLTAQS